MRLMVELHRLGATKAPVQLGRVAEITGISRRYLEQLTITLKSHSLLRGVSGRNGGYVFAKAPAEISIREVLAAVIGPIELSVCVAEPESCLRADFCG